MYRNKQPSRSSFLVIVISLFFFGCGATGDPITGPCSYTETSGQATIVSLNNSNPSEYNCSNDPVEVVFHFTPSDPLRANDMTDNSRHLLVGDGMNPQRNYIISKGFAVGTIHECKRNIIKSGGCSPVVFAFPNVDLSDYGSSCYSTQ